MEKNVGTRWLVIGIVLLAGFALLWPPQKRLRAGLDIAGGTSMIFEIDTTAAGGDVNLAERVKTLLQRRVDPSGIYNLTWRVHGRNRIEVQMPLPPKEATQRRQAYADALKDLYDQELRRGAVEIAVRARGEEREAALRRLAEGRRESALAAIAADDPQAQAKRDAIERIVSERHQLLRAAAAQWDALQVVEAKVAEQAASQPTPETAPAADALKQELRDAQELYEDAVQEVLATNLNRRRFEEIIELDRNSPVRKKSLPEIVLKHADLHDKIAAALATYDVWRQGKQFLDSPADLKRLLRGAGKLEFRILATPDRTNPGKYDRYRRQLQENQPRRPQDDLGWFRIDNPLQFFNYESPADLETRPPEQSESYVVEKFDNHYWVLAKMDPRDGLLKDVKGQRDWRLQRAMQDRDQRGRPSVAFVLDDVGGQMFATLTRNNIDKPLCILVDDVAYSAPNIRSEIRTHGVIEGDFSQEKIWYLVQTMEGGQLPARLKETPVSERTIGSSLGEKNRDYAVRAGMIGTVAVLTVMLGYYWLCGAIASVAMLMNVLLTLAMMAMLGARITLDGIAGLILAVGMSVDANVLIYERMREEKQRGASLRMMIKNGYEKAFTTIFDSNVTTLLTCLIIYYVGSEEVKGFGMMLGWGIALNMFTAVFVTRSVFAVLLKYNVIKGVGMLKLIRVPSIDWYSKSKFLIPVSFLVVLTGVGLLALRGSDILDIEFRGGVAAEFELKPSAAGVSDVEIGRRLQQIGHELAADARKLEQAAVSATADEPGVFVVQVPGVASARLAAMLTEPLEAENLLRRGGVRVRPGSDQLGLAVQGEVTADDLAARIRGLSGALAKSADDLATASVNAVLESGGVAGSGRVWNVTTTVTNMRMVEHAITSALGDEMRIQPQVQYEFRGRGDRPYPITDRLLSGVVPGVGSPVEADLTDYLGGAAMVFERLDPPLPLHAIEARISSMYFQPDFKDQTRRDFTVIGLNPADGRADEQGRPLYSSVVVATVDPEIRYSADPETWWTGFAQPQLTLVERALSTEQTLRKVMQFKPQIAARSSQQALIALLLSWGMIIGYVWIRFGRVSYGIGGVVALVHDVLVALAFVGFSGWIAQTAFGRALLVEDFKINMPVIAALLTIIGFSINDTIVIFDRIREIRGRLGIVTPQIINNAINECMSRTILTTFTVLVVLVIAYIWGGSSIRGFNYCMIVGSLSGVYSTIVIASPMLLLGKSVQRQPALAPATAT